MSPSGKPLVIPVFIPHQGCPHQCLFCNQNSITGQATGAGEGPVEIEETIRSWLAGSRGRSRVQVAFYGGSFTCLPEERQLGMLACVQPFLDRGEVHGIRLSTRPDCVDAGVCAFLKNMGVSTVEVGVQSLNDEVLRRSRRGHTARDCRLAVQVLHEAGIEVGLQLMPGLPGETIASFLGGVREVIALAPSFVRLYPALVVAHSGLAEMFENGEYSPLDLNRAVALCRRAKEMFGQAGIRVVRIGLQPSVSLEKDLIAGPYHPAFGELVAARDWLRKIRAVFTRCPEGSHVTVHVAERDLSAVLGPKRMNMQRLAGLGLAQRLRLVPDKEMQRGTLRYVVG